MGKSGEATGIAIHVAWDRWVGHMGKSGEATGMTIHVVWDR
jgi:hypothetical protein